MDAAAVRERAAALPRAPGVYQFLAGDRPIYIGKAVVVRDRVRSYADPASQRTAQMVDDAEAIETAVTDTETQALLLEANLIKRHQPRYNVRLKDDKSYPLVQFTDHEVPRIEVTRDPDDTATVFGPYTNKGDVETVIKAVRETFGLRGCSDHKYAGRARPCLDYDMGLCSAPCTGEVDAATYRDRVADAERFFAGETGVLAGPMAAAMETAAETQRFERAAHLRDRLAVVEGFHGGGAEAVSSRADERAVDVIGVSIEGTTATVARLHSQRGQLVDRSRHRLDAPGDGAGAAEVIGAFLTQYYTERELPDAILLSEAPADTSVERWLTAAGVAVRVPGVGREAKLVELALKNAAASDRRVDAVGRLASVLQSTRPRHIEGFDISHAQGRAVVGSNVWFVDGQADTAGYRRKRLSSGNDDVGHIAELLAWRAQRAPRDDRPDPDLLLIDGGPTQLSAAVEATEAAGWTVPAVALAKREEQVFTPDGPLQLADDDPALHLLQRVRDEAHRFAVQYHQTLRDDVQTVLEAVPGVGPSTRQALLRRFGSVENIRQASRADLEDVPGVGPQTAQTLRERL